MFSELKSHTEMLPPTLSSPKNFGYPGFGILYFWTPIKYQYQFWPIIFCQYNTNTNSCHFKMVNKKPIPILGLLRAIPYNPNSEPILSVWRILQPNHIRNKLGCYGVQLEFWLDALAKPLQGGETIFVFKKLFICVILRLYT